MLPSLSDAVTVRLWTPGLRSSADPFGTEPSQLAMPEPPSSSVQVKLAVMASRAVVPVTPTTASPSAGEEIVIEGGVTSTTGSPFGRFKRPIVSEKAPVNQTFASGPAVMPNGPLSMVGTSNSTIAPVGEMAPTALPSRSVNQTLPSGPRASPAGELFGVGSENRVTVPSIARRPIV